MPDAPPAWAQDSQPDWAKQSTSVKPDWAYREPPKTPEKEPSLGERFFAMPEAAAALITQFGFGVPMNIGGRLGTLLAQKLGLTKESAEDVGAILSQAVTYQPKTPGGKRQYEAWNKPFDIFFGLGPKAGGAAYEAAQKPDTAETAQLRALTSKYAAEEAAPYQPTTKELAPLEAAGMETIPTAASLAAPGLKDPTLGRFTGREGLTRGVPAEKPFEAPQIETPPRTGTSSGVPIKLDRLIAQAEREPSMPPTPDIRKTIRQTAQEALQARQAQLTPGGARPRPEAETPAGAPPAWAGGAETGISPKLAPMTQESAVVATSVVQSEARTGGTEAGQQYQVGQHVGFTDPVEHALFEVWRYHDPTRPATPQARIRSIADLKEALRDLTPEQTQKWGHLFGTPINQLIGAGDAYFMKHIDKTAYYYDYIRGQLNEERRAQEAQGRPPEHLGVVAPPIDQVMRKTPPAGEIPPTAPVPPKPAPKPAGGFPTSLFEERGAEPPSVAPGEPAIAPVFTVKGGPKPEPLEISAPKPTELTGKTKKGSEKPVAHREKIEPDPRLKDPNNVAMLVSMSKEAGWAEQGGRMIVDETTRAKRPGGGDVLGRTNWVGQEWYRGLQSHDETKLSPREVRQMASKIERGMKLSRQEMRASKYMLDWLEDEQERQGGKGAAEPAAAPGSAEAAKEELTDEQALEKYGPGTLGMNVIFDPAVAGAYAKRLATAVRNVTNVIPNAPPDALGAIGAVDEHLHNLRAARDSAETAKGTPEAKLRQEYVEAVNDAWRTDPKFRIPMPPTTAAEMVAHTEMIRRRTSAYKLRDKLLKNGDGSLTRAKGFSEVALEDLRLPSGRYMHIKDSAVPGVRQMLEAYDPISIKAEQSSILGKAGDVSMGAVTGVMLNPGFHLFTVSTRMLPFSIKGNPILSPARVKASFELYGNRDARANLIKKGIRFMGRQYSQKAYAHEVGMIEGWMKQNAISGKAYDVWHQLHDAIMVDNVNRWQIAFYLMRKEEFLRKGIPLQQAEAMAAKQANTFAGNIPKEEYSRRWYQFLKATLFSRGYSSSIVRQVTGAFTQDKLLMARLKNMGIDDKEIAKRVNQNKGNLMKALLYDYAWMQITANVANYTMTGIYNVEDNKGKKGPHFTWDNVNVPRETFGERATAMLFPDRIFIKRDDDGQDTYIGNPFRTTRDMILFLTRPDKWYSNKAGPLINAGDVFIRQRDRLNRPVETLPQKGAALAGIVTPFGELAREGATAYEIGDVGYFETAMKDTFGDAAIDAMTGTGLQVRREQQNIRVGESSKIYKEQQAVRDMAVQSRRVFQHASPETRSAIEKKLLTDATKSGMTRQQQQELIKELRKAPGSVSKSQARRAGTLERRQDQPQPSPEGFD